MSSNNSTTNTSSHRSNRTRTFSSTRTTPWSSSLSSTDDEYIARMIANTEIIDGTLYPTVVDDEEEMEETYHLLAEQNSDADDEEDGSEEEDGDEDGDGEALHGSGWLVWNVVGVVGVAVVAWMVYKCRK